MTAKIIPFYKGKKTYKCSFCKKEVEKAVKSAINEGVYICPSCIKVCLERVASDENIGS